MSTRRFTVRRVEAGRPLADWLRARLSLPRSAVLGLLRQRQVRLDGVPCLDPTRRLRRGQRIEVSASAPRPPAARKPKPARPVPTAPGGSVKGARPAAGSSGGRGKGARPAAGSSGGRGKGARPAAGSSGGRAPMIRHADEQIVVVEKPPGLTTMRHAEETAEFGARARRFLPTTLADLLPGLLAHGTGRPAPVRAVHRLDKETSGLVVFARTAAAESNLGRQFRAHTTERVYLAIVRGQARPGRIESWLIKDRGDGRRGSSPQPGEGQRAVTHVRVVEQLGDFTLVECRLETGRTHQVRIHLGEAGTPLCGERVYDRPLNGRPLPDTSGAPRIALHAATLGFDHPATGRRMHFTSPLPPDLAKLVERLRGRKG
jgi:23S rRNA pseudouridine1911/1915/1917 synthase